MISEYYENMVKRFEGEINILEFVHSMFRDNFEATLIKELVDTRLQSAKMCKDLIEAKQELLVPKE